MRSANTCGAFKEERSAGKFGVEAEVEADGLGLVGGGGSTNVTAAGSASLGRFFLTGSPRDDFSRLNRGGGEEARSEEG